MLNRYENKVFHAVDIPTDRWVFVRAIDYPVTLKARRVLAGSCCDLPGCKGTIVDVESVAILGADEVRIIPITAFNKLYRRP